jgi:hypothetical protein
LAARFARLGTIRIITVHLLFRAASAAHDLAIKFTIRDDQLLMLIWWAARQARMIDEVPRGGDQQLVAWAAGWMDELHEKYRRYLALALIFLASFKY